MNWVKKGKLAAKKHPTVEVKPTPEGLVVIRDGVPEKLEGDPPYRVLIPNGGVFSTWAGVRILTHDTKTEGHWAVLVEPGDGTDRDARERRPKELGPEERK
jgi:hypothetical protein